jgi:hypothetical protein
VQEPQTEPSSADLAQQHAKSMHLAELLRQRAEAAERQLRENPTADRQKKRDQLASAAELEQLKAEKDQRQVEETKRREYRRTSAEAAESEQLGIEAAAAAELHLRDKINDVAAQMSKIDDLRSEIRESR